MAALLALSGAVAGLAVGVWAGLAAGRRIQERAPWVFWLVNAAFVLLGLVINVIGLSIRQLWFAMIGLGLLAGGLTGLKYGYGRVVGAWKVIDRLADTAASMAGQPAVRDHRKRAGNASADPYRPDPYGRDPLGRHVDKVDPTVGFGRPKKRPRR